MIKKHQKRKEMKKRMKIEKHVQKKEAEIEKAEKFPNGNIWQKNVSYQIIDHSFIICNLSFFRLLFIESVNRNERTLEGSNKCQSWEIMA